MQDGLLRWVAVGFVMWAIVLEVPLLGVIGIAVLIYDVAPELFHLRDRP